MRVEVCHQKESRKPSSSLLLVLSDKLPGLDIVTKAVLDKSIVRDWYYYKNS